MQVINLAQPWASLVVHGIKRFHVTDDNPEGIRALAIYTPTPSAQEMAILTSILQERYVRDDLAQLDVNIHNLPLGGIIGEVTVKRVIPSHGYLSANKKERIYTLNGRRYFNYPQYLIEFGQVKAYDKPAPIAPDQVGTGYWQWQAEPALVAEPPAPQEQALDPALAKKKGK